MTGHPQALRTDRLWLLPVDLADARDLLAGGPARLPPGVRPGRGWPHELTLLALAAAVDRGEDPTGTWWVVQADPDRASGGPDGEVVGECGQKGAPGPDGVAEIGYSLAPAYRGRGLGTEAVQALVGWVAAQPGCRQVVAEVAADNLPSRRLLARLGFREQAFADGYLWLARSASGGGMTSESRPPP